MVSAREEILDRLKTVRNKRGEIADEKPDFTSSVYLPLHEDLAEEFGKKIELAGGKLFRTKTIEEAVAQLQNIIEKNQWQNIFCKDQILQKYLSGKIEYSSDDQSFGTMQVGITRCEYLIAHLGSVLVSSGQPSGRRLNVFPEIQVIFATENQLIDYLENGLERIKEKYAGNMPSLISFITGASRTADIEKTLVKGMHGPKSVLVFLCKKTF